MSENIKLKVVDIQVVEKIVEVPVPDVTSEGIINRTIDYIETLTPTIGDYTFYGCSKLISVDAIRATSIGRSTFEGCSLIESINAPNVANVGASAFYECAKLSSFCFDNVETIGPSAFRSTGLNGILTLPVCTDISQTAFQLDSEITEIHAPELLSISASTFYDCRKIAVFDAPKLQTIGAQSFGNCYALRELYFPEVTSTGTNPFAYTANNLQKVVFDKITSLGGAALNGFKFDLIIKTPTMCTIGAKPANTFKGRIFVPASLVDTYKSNTYWSVVASKIYALEDYESMGPNPNFPAGDAGVTDGPGLMEGSGTTEETPTYEYSRFVGYACYLYVPDGTEETETDSGSTDYGSTDSGSTESGPTKPGPTKPGPTNPGIIIDPGMGGGPGLM